jgi:hypothetical protein
MVDYGLWIERPNYNKIGIMEFWKVGILGDQFLKLNFECKYLNTHYFITPLFQYLIFSSIISFSIIPYSFIPERVTRFQSCSFPEAGLDH